MEAAVSLLLVGLALLLGYDNRRTGIGWDSTGQQARTRCSTSGDAGVRVVGYVFKKIGIPPAPFTLALVLGGRAENAFRLLMIGAGGDIAVFWSNGLVGSITTPAIALLFWPVIDKAFGIVGRLRQPAKTVA